MRKSLRVALPLASVRASSFLRLPTKTFPIVFFVSKYATDVSSKATLNNRLVGGTCVAICCQYCHEQSTCDPLPPVGPHKIKSALGPTSRPTMHSTRSPIPNAAPFLGPNMGPNWDPRGSQSRPQNEFKNKHPKSEQIYGLFMTHTPFPLSPRRPHEVFNLPTQNLIVRPMGGHDF